MASSFGQRPEGRRTWMRIWSRSRWRSWRAFLGTRIGCEGAFLGRLWVLPTCTRGQCFLRRWLSLWWAFGMRIWFRSLSCAKCRCHLKEMWAFGEWVCHYSFAVVILLIEYLMWFCSMHKKSMNSQTTGTVNNTYFVCNIFRWLWSSDSLKKIDLLWVFFLVQLNHCNIFCFH